MQLSEPSKLQLAEPINYVANNGEMLTFLNYGVGDEEFRGTVRPVELWRLKAAPGRTVRFVGSIAVIAFASRRFGGRTILSVDVEPAGEWVNVKLVFDGGTLA